MDVPPGEFEDLVEEALEAVPPFFRARLHNVAVSAEDIPGPEAGSLAGSPALLGLYAGLSRGEMLSPDAPAVLPARVYLYRRNIAALCATREELRRQVSLTLRHELAHHFGFDDAELRRVWPEGA